MCGRFTLAKETAELTALLPNVDCNDWTTPRFNIAPTQEIAVITNLRPSKLAIVKWGLIPFWAKDESIGAKMINARAETLAEKPAFRKLVNRRRCVILADGFYEWQSAPGTTGKRPHYFHLKDRSVFGFAGLWDEWSDPQKGTITSCTIITTQANQLVRQAHSRMAVMLDPVLFPQWLDLSRKLDSDVAPLLGSYPADKMAMLPVSRRVNNVSVDSPMLIAPIQPGQSQISAFTKEE